MTKDHDIHLWLTSDDYAWVARKAREEDRSKNAFLTRLIRRARAESMEDDDEITRDELGHFRPGKACKGCEP